MQSFQASKGWRTTQLWGGKRMFCVLGLLVPTCWTFDVRIAFRAALQLHRS